jgi:hypothetical protein
MTLTVIYRADETTAPVSKPYHIVAHETVPEKIALEVAREFETYPTGDAERFAFKYYETGNERKRLVIDYERAVAIHGTDAETSEPCVWEVQRNRENESALGSQENGA